MKLLTKKGQSLSEYLILTALISVGSIAVVQLLSRNLRTKFVMISESIRGEKDSKLKGVEAKEHHYETLDLSDFNKGERFAE